MPLIVELPTVPATLSPIAVLFHPSAVPFVDVFRTLDRLEDQYDLALLDGPERALAAYTPPDTAKGIISDALLMAFALTRQRGRPFCHRPLGSRHESVDEYCLMTLIGSMHAHASELRLEAAAALGVASLDFMASLVGEIGRQMDSGSVVFETPTLPEFRAIVGDDAVFETYLDEPLNRSGFHFKN